MLLGLWMPDEAETIRKDPLYAVRVANRKVDWWISPADEYGVNVLGEVKVLP